MKQTKISYWLKAITIILGMIGGIFFGWVTYLAMQMKAEDDSIWLAIGCSWYIALLCYLVLIEFWKVCTQIGADNSFSVENAKCFHRMAIYGGCAGAGYAARLIWWLVAIRGAHAEIAFLSIGEILLSLVFIVLCEALSKLISYAYEVKHENELTI